MSKEFQNDSCFLCGNPARSATYDRGKGKVFVDCANKVCGEYLITNSAMKILRSDAETCQNLSSRATSREEIKARKEILEITYEDGVVAKIKPLTEVLSPQAISKFGFSGSGE